MFSSINKQSRYDNSNNIFYLGLEDIKDSKEPISECSDDEIFQELPSFESFEELINISLSNKLEQSEMVEESEEVCKLSGLTFTSVLNVLSNTKINPDSTLKDLLILSHQQARLMRFLVNEGITESKSRPELSFLSDICDRMKEIAYYSNENLLTLHDKIWSALSILE